MMVKVVAIARAMPRLINWRSVKSGLIDERGVLDGGGIGKR